jgi:bZIP transcription factor
MVLSTCSKMDSVVTGTPDANSPLIPVSNDRVNIGSSLYASNHIGLPTSTSKRPLEDITGSRSAVGNVSVTSSSSVGSSSDDESVSAAHAAPVTNKKQKITSIISDDSSDDDDAVPGLIVSGSFQQDATSKATSQNRASTSGSPANTGSSHYQKKYEPPTSKNMSKVELSLWRKQQRQQRNRMSAAASRQKQKARISELEQEIAEYQQKYAAVQMEIQRLQQQSLLQPTKVTPPTTQAHLPVAERNSNGNIYPDMNIEVVPTFHSSSSPSSASPPPPELVNLSYSNTPFKMISRQALSQELSFTPPLFFQLI